MEGKVFFAWLLVIALLFTHTTAITRKSQRTLVVVDNMAFMETHSLFFDTLRGISFLYIDSW